MKYRNFGRTPVKVSALGFGCMRLPTVGENIVDIPQAVSIIRRAIDKGVNYLDTAYGYIGGESEKTVGLALQDGYRERVMVATKFPCWEFKQKGDFERILKIQLKRLKTDYLDCYMLHALGRDSFRKIAVENGVLENLVAAKKSGKVKHIGFSFHDNIDAFKTIVDHTDVWDFCQIQYNYMDTANQAGIEGLRYAAARGISVIVMEPLLGGKLADKMPADVQTVFDGTGKTNTEWALDFVWNHPEVSMLLSGMGTKQMVDDNIKYANRSKPGMLTAEDTKTIARARQALSGKDAIPCTGCEYCLPVCPKKIQIPTTFLTYNEYARAKKNKKSADSETRTAEALNKFRERSGGRAADCISCGACVKRCPQQIPIPRALKKIAKETV